MTLLRIAHLPEWLNKCIKKKLNKNDYLKPLFKPRESCDHFLKAVESLHIRPCKLPCLYHVNLSLVDCIQSNLIWIFTPLLRFEKNKCLHQINKVTPSMVKSPQKLLMFLIYLSLKSATWTFYCVMPAVVVFAHNTAQNAQRAFTFGQVKTS